MKRFSFILSAVLLLLVQSCGPKQEVVQKTQVVPVTIKDTAVTLSMNFPATLRGVQDIAIYPQVTGRIMKVLVREGQKVKAGQVLFEIDDIPFTSAYDVAKANLEMAKAGVETANLTYQSKKNLFDRQVISEYQLKLAYNDLLTAKAALSQAKANLVKAQNDLSFTKVCTMVSGQVGSLPYKIGSLVGPNIQEPLTIVSDNSKVYADFSIPENVYLYLKRANDKEELPVSLVTNDGQNYPVQGKLHSMSGLISANTGALPVRSLFNNPEALLLSGGSCTVVFSYNAPAAILIPRSAMKEIQDKLFVFKIEDGKLVQTEVKASRFNNTFWLLEMDKDGNTPIKAGDLITATTNRLRDGEEVEIKK